MMDQTAEKQIPASFFLFKLTVALKKQQVPKWYKRKILGTSQLPSGITNPLRFLLL